MKELVDADINSEVKEKKEVKGKLPELHEILTLLKKGYSQSQIAQMFSASRQSVNKLLKKHNLLGVDNDL